MLTIKMIHAMSCICWYESRFSLAFYVFSIKHSIGKQRRVPAPHDQRIQGSFLVSHSRHMDFTVTSFNILCWAHNYNTFLIYLLHVRIIIARDSTETETYCHKVALKRTARHWPRSRAPRDPCDRYRTPIVTVTHTFDFSSQLVAASFKYFTIVYVVTDCSSIPARHSVTVVRLRHSTQSHNTPLPSLLNKYLQNNVGLLFLRLLLRLPQAQVPRF